MANSADLNSTQTRHASQPGVHSRRFEWVTARAKTGPDRPSDRDLADLSVAAIVPSKGALTSDWLLVVPRSPCLAVGQLQPASRAEVLSCARMTADAVRRVAGEAVIFEHGASGFGSPHGCGVDQAHLHVVGLPEQFVSYVAEQTPEFRWQSVSTDDPWAGIPIGSDYLLVMSSTTALVAIVHRPTSQLLRKQAASYLQRRDEWNYKSHPQAANVARIVENFSDAFAPPDAG